MTHEGIFHALRPAGPDFDVLLRMAKPVQPRRDAWDDDGAAGGAAAADWQPVRPVPLLTVPAAELVAISATDVRMGAADVGTAGGAWDDAGGFGTDAAISRARGQWGRERELQRWAPDEGEGALLHLEEAVGPVERGWDQFAVNEAKFGVRTDYAEELYTTELDPTCVLGAGWAGLAGQGWLGGAGWAGLAGRGWLGRAGSRAGWTGQEGVGGACDGCVLLRGAGAAASGRLLTAAGTGSMRWHAGPNTRRLLLLAGGTHAARLLPATRPRRRSKSRISVAEAARIAAEIERGDHSRLANIHMLEERGVAIDDSQMDEEDRYGAVVRDERPAPAAAAAAAAAANGSKAAPPRPNAWAQGRPAMPGAAPSAPIAIDTRREANKLRAQVRASAGAG